LNLLRRKMRASFISAHSAVIYRPIKANKKAITTPTCIYLDDDGARDSRLHTSNIYSSHHTHKQCMFTVSIITGRDLDKNALMFYIACQIYCGVHLSLHKSFLLPYQATAHTHICEDALCPLCYWER
jgi:hypothetical protein